MLREVRPGFQKSRQREDQPGRRQAECPLPTFGLQNPLSTFTPAVPAILPLPSITGNATPALQTHQVNAGFHFNF